MQAQCAKPVVVRGTVRTAGAFRRTYWAGSQPGFTRPVRNHHGANRTGVVSIGYVRDRILLVTFFRSKLLRRHSSRNSVNCAMYSIAVSSEGFEAPIRTIEVIWSMTLQP